MSDKRSGKKAKAIRGAVPAHSDATPVVVSDLTQHAPMKKKHGK
jgi:hypothetical protein